MKSHKFDAFNPIFIISILSAFDQTCDRNGLHDGSALWILQFSMKGSFAAAHNVRLCLNRYRCWWRIIQKRYCLEPTWKWGAIFPRPTPPVISLQKMTPLSRNTFISRVCHRRNTRNHWLRKYFDVGPYAMNMSWKKYLLKDYMIQSAKACDPTRLRMPMQRFTNWLISRRHSVLCKWKQTQIAGPTIVAVPNTAKEGEGALQ